LDHHADKFGLGMKFMLERTIAAPSSKMMIERLGKRMRMQGSLNHSLH